MMIDHAYDLGIEVIYDEVSKVEVDGNIKKLTTPNGVYEAKVVIVATGNVPRRLGVENEDALAMNGISWCAICDGAFFRDKDIIVDQFIYHEVLPKETIYSITKRYDITEEDLKKNNTFLYANALQKNDELKIPVFKITKVEAKSTTKTYIVKPKEGKWRVAYKFGITLKELEMLNPDMKAVLDAGEIIKVPNIAETEENEIDERYSYYTVLPKEGFYRLKLKLDIEQEDIEALNPGLKESGLKSGMVLKIPHNNTIAVSSVETSNDDLTDKIESFETKHIALMLPFRLDRVNPDSLYDTKKQIKNDIFLSTSLDFYSGVLMAVDSLKHLGISLKVDVYDTKNQLSQVGYLLNTNDLKNADAVIGPLMPKNLERVASDLKNKNVTKIFYSENNLK